MDGTQDKSRDRTEQNQEFTTFVLSRGTRLTACESETHSSTHGQDQLFYFEISER